MPLVGAKDHARSRSSMTDMAAPPIRSLTGSSASAAAEDVTQEAFISIWRSGARFDRTRGSVRAWMLEHRAQPGDRRPAPRPAKPRASTSTMRGSSSSPAEERTEAEALRRETASEVRGALSQLPGDQSKVIQLAYFGGFSHSEISRMLGDPLGTVKGRMRLGLEKIRGSWRRGSHERSRARTLER